MPTEICDIPPEILAAAFEMGIYTWGIGFICPVSLVCSTWRDVVDHTPRLWGIILINKRDKSIRRQLAKQLTKAKEAPLSIISGLNANTVAGRRFMDQLAALAHNWVMADIDTLFLSRSRWSVLRHGLEELVLSRSGHPDDSTGPIKAFFEDEDGKPCTLQPSKLCSFTANRLPRDWVIPFLSPTIRHFHFNRGFDYFRPGNPPGHNMRDTWDYLSRIPNATSIDLVGIIYAEPIRDQVPVVRLPYLQTLQLQDVLFPATVLSAIAAPSLKTLSIDRKRPDYTQGWYWQKPDIPVEDIRLAPLFVQWSQPNFVTTHLHTLELKECLDLPDVPYLIRWLERLPNLIRLFLTEDEIGWAASKSEDSESNLYRALSLSRTMEDGTSGWLCPRLMIIHLDTGQEISDILSIACARGVTAPAVDDIPSPRHLRRIETRLCPDSSKEDLEKLRSLVDFAYCICNNCGLMVEDA